MPDSNTHAEEYIKKCVEYGHTNYFTTNHGSFGDIFEAKTLCDKYGIRCIAGIEGYIVPDPTAPDASNFHIVIIPRTNKARRKMNRISSHANIFGFYRRPRMFIEELLMLDKDDVYITTACVAGLLKNEISIEQLFTPLYRHFGENLLLEVQNHDNDLQKEVNMKALALHKEFGLKLIAANDSHYVDTNGKNERLELLKGKGISYGDEDTFVLDFPTYEEMRKRFLQQDILTEKEIDEAIENTLIFDDCEEIDINKEIKMPTIYPELSLNERYDLLEKMVWDRFSDIKAKENITGEELQRYEKGINYELQTIKNTNDVVHTADYFLYNEKNVSLAVNKYGGVLTRGGRGSCGSFYVNKILGMTQLDRFKINLPIFPDRFASTARLVENRSLPDIDYNVKSQDPFVAAARELLGYNGCYPMIAYGTMQISEAFRNVCRSHGLEYEEFNKVAKNLESHMEEKKWKPYIDEASRYVDTIVSASVHPCAHILSTDDLIDEYGVVRVGKNICVMITSGEADEYKVLKDDFLIVKIWLLIDETCKMAGIPIPDWNVVYESIKDDDRIWNLFKNGITCTLNQVDSDNGTAQAKEYGISSFEDGAFIAAAIRPSFDSWRQKFLKREDYTTGSKALDEVLGMTKGYILFQENLMQYFDWLGITPAESIGLIKKISKKKIKPDDFAKLETRIKKQWIINTGSEDMFAETWEMIQSCMAYGFCSAHAAATSVDMCYGAYLKVHYTYEYYCVCFNAYNDDLVRTRKLRDELSYFGITLEGLRFRESRSSYSFDKNEHTIYKGMSSIKFMNDIVPEELYALRDNHYNNFISVLIDIKNKTSANSRQIEALITLDYFSEFGDINKLMAIYEKYCSLYSRKQFKKSELDKYGLVDADVKPFSNKETEKMYTGVDTYSMLMSLINKIDVKPVSLQKKLEYQNESLGYIDICDKRYKNLGFVMDVDTKYAPKLSVYALANGNTIECKVDKRTFNRMKVAKNYLIRIQETTYKPRMSRNADGTFVPIEGTRVLWLTKYKRVLM